MTEKINVSILGSTGSIGTQTLQVIEAHPEVFNLVGLACGSNVDLLAEQIEKFQPTAVSIYRKECYPLLKDKLNGYLPDIFVGAEGNAQIATLSESDRVIIATPGYAAFIPTLEAIRNRKVVALATKEVLVSAGDLMLEEAKKAGTSIIPVDSEHSAIFQCIAQHSHDEIARLILTCSGGPLRGKSKLEVENATKEQVLKHPTWNMGAKITVDSATLMNKGLEVIEANKLFGIPYEKIEVVVHPQSIVHSAVEFVDGSILAQMGAADMRIPIQYALLYPQVRKQNPFGRYKFWGQSLTFERPDTDKFPCLPLAYQAGKIGGSMPAVMNAANDIANEAFLDDKIEFPDIPKIVALTMCAHRVNKPRSLMDVLDTDRWARNYANELVKFG